MIINPNCDYFNDEKDSKYAPVESCTQCYRYNICIRESNEKINKFVDETIEKAKQLGIDCLISTNVSSSYTTNEKNELIDCTSNAYDKYTLSIRRRDDNYVRFYDLYNFIDKIMRNTEWIYNKVRFLGTSDSKSACYCYKLEGDVYNTYDDSGIGSTVTRIRNPLMYIYKIDSITMIPHPLFVFMRIDSDNIFDTIFRVYLVSEDCRIITPKHVDIHMDDLIYIDRVTMKTNMWYEIIQSDLDGLIDIELFAKDLSKIVMDKPI